MKLETAANIAKTFYSLLNIDDDLEGVLVAILRIFNFSWEEGVLSFHDDRSFIFPKPKKIIYSNKITPVDLDRFDIECIEDILNNPKYITKASQVSALFDAIGWVVTNECGIIKIHFEGSDTYEVWNEPMMRWDDDIDDDEQCNWWEGDGWVDNLKFDEINFDWKNFMDELEDK